MNKLMMMFTLFSCFFYMSCKEIDRNNISSIKESTNGYIIHHLKNEQTALYTSDYYCFTKAKDTINIFLEVITRKDSNSVLKLNYGIPNSQNTRVMIPFPEQIKLLEVFLKGLSKNDSVKKIKSVVLPLLLGGDIDAEITNEYYKTRGRVSLDSIVYRSKMRHILDSTFSPYHIYIEKVFIGKFALIDKSIIKKYNIPVPNDVILPPKLIDGYVSFNMQNTREP